MKGKHIISIASRKAIYHLELERKISVLKGNSGTGKIARVFSGDCGQRTAMLLLFHEAAGLQLCLIQSSEYMNLSQKKRE